VAGSQAGRLERLAAVSAGYIAPSYGVAYAAAVAVAAAGVLGKSHIAAAPATAAGTDARSCWLSWREARRSQEASWVLFSAQPVGPS